MVQTKPNIVLVMVDDAPERLWDYLPKTNTAIVTQGAKVENFLYSQPVCAPSRATVLRGQYSHNTGIYGNSFDGESALWHFRRNGGEKSTLASWLRGAGYRTALVGKYMNGYGQGSQQWYKPTGWDYFFAVSGDAGDAYNYYAYDNGTTRFYGADPDLHYLTNVIRQKADSFLDAALPSDTPFFLMVTPKAPHHPAVPHPTYESDYPSVTYPKGAENPSFNEADVSDKPDYVRFQDPISRQEEADIDENYRNKLRAMRSVDDLVESLVVKIGAEMANTYMIFCSDNGFHAGEHRLGHGNANGGKNTPYEEDIRVPLYIRGPGIAPGSSIDHLVGNVDLAPTICEIAGARIDPRVKVDGRSFLPLVKGQSVTWRNYFLLSRGKGEAYAGIRASDFTFVEFDAAQTGPDGEYYDLVADRPQLDNLYDSLSAPVLEDLQERVAALRTCSGSSCRAAEV